MDAERIKGRDAAYRKVTTNDPTGEKRAIWETAYRWGKLQGYKEGQEVLRNQFKTLLEGYCDE